MKEHSGGYVTEAKG